MRLILTLIEHAKIQLQLGEETTNIREFLLVLLQASPLAQLFLVTFIVTQVTHRAPICLRTHALGYTARICRCGGVAFEADEGIDEGVEVGFRFGGRKDVGV